MWQVSWITVVNYLHIPSRFLRWVATCSRTNLSALVVLSASIPTPQLYRSVDALKSCQQLCTRTNLHLRDVIVHQIEYKYRHGKK